MNGSYPFLSVIVPVYNAEKTLSKCLDSLTAQDYPSDRYEIIAVDNNSKDRSREIIERYLVRYVLENQCQGPSAARNAGVKHSSGEGLIFFDADQVAEKNYFKRLLQGWEDRKFGAFSGRNIGMDSTDSVLGKYWREEWSEKHDRPAEGLLIFSGGLILMRREVFEKLGGFDPELMTCEDIDLAWRMQKELGLTIKYNLDAISYHLERIDLRSLLKREYAFGYGKTLLGRKHREAYSPLAPLFLKTIVRTILGFGALLVGGIKVLVGKKRISDLQLILLDVAMKWSHWRGRMAAALSSKGMR